jgi:hypothetical protein
MVAIVGILSLSLVMISPDHEEESLLKDVIETSSTSGASMKRFSGTVMDVYLSENFGCLNTYLTQYHSPSKDGYGNLKWSGWGRHVQAYELYLQA